MKSIDTIRQLINREFKELPKKEKEILEKFFVICLRFFALEDVVEKETITGFAFNYHQIITKLKNCKYDEARELMGQYISQLQLRRSW